ncbi:hypothetical protein ABDJ41_00865 [Pedobacter sp. ASV1-7]|uniref:hypothetical protein n=1 Tax=Pedobacter sp. ASV1-7 TaxID=3145237 RepID=UPI0032E8B844
MNFDDLKSAWNKESSSNITIPDKVEELKRAELPLDKIKRNMKNELIAQIAAIILLGFFPQIFNFKPVLYTPFYAVYILLVITSIYFFTRFYFFYKRISNVSLSTKDTLYEVNYDIKLNMELYKLFCYMMFPFMIVQVSLLLINSEYDRFIKLFETSISNGSFYLYFTIVTVVTYTFLHFCAIYWLKSYYSKYATEIENILKELKEE